MLRMATRRATHAGSWYNGRASVLARELTEWLQSCENDPEKGPLKGRARAIIVPHAGYRYSGFTAAAAFKQMKTDDIKRVFVFGPSHHLYMRQAALPAPRVKEYATPFGNLALDQDILAQLAKTGKFDELTMEADEDEHSLEMELPFIAHLLKGKEYTLIPVMVGHISAQLEAEYGKMFAPFFEDPSNVFVISSDFCHWGRRFGFSPYDASYGPIYKSIEAMDRRGMEAIESQDPKAFRVYLDETENSICGRRAIGMMMHTLVASSLETETSFVCYRQSSKVQSKGDSSVSYAAGCVVVQ